ncbi:hypothetical protein QJS04_geneDACA013993 [Acorus gramineus]|uniref:Uncharacterized protein n=1 Tax=Acorus gramineus TaxID=55184 RepID=A0AAV9B064_ACOGR|nr:hypothetical protein QJS04_geneDACA013993 [Acorus gramineus]
MMEGFLPAPAKMKRKDLEEMHDEFSEFSLTSPARKIRRLDLELPPIMEEEEPVVMPPPPVDVEQQLMVPMDEAVPPSLPLSEDRAIVVYKQVESPLYRVDPELIESLKNQVFCSHNCQSNMAARLEEEAMASRDTSSTMTSEGMAIIPWVPSQAPLFQGTAKVAHVDGVPGAIEAEAETTSMEIEEDSVKEGVAGIEGGEGGLQYWQQQQHCMTQDLPPSACSSTPPTWSW